MEISATHVLLWFQFHVRNLVIHRTPGARNHHFVFFLSYFQLAHYELKTFTVKSSLWFCFCACVIIINFPYDCCTC